MFELQSQTCKLNKFAPRTEFHGQEPHAAGDLYFEANIAASDVLPMFHPALRSLLYWKADEPGDMVDQAHDAPNLRLQELGLPLKWELGELVGATLTIHRGLGGRSDLVIETCAVNDFKLTPKEGGTCVVQFRVQGELPKGAGGALCDFVQQDVSVTIEPPEASAETPTAA